ncbi:MAG: diaminopimelate epimerase [Halodesulfurarchaeum sp.]
MTEVAYRQYHGTGNSFAVVESEDFETGRSAFAEAACEDLGVDGVLFLSLSRTGTPTAIEFRLYQPDGSTAAMCGNGARVAARWGRERTGESTFRLDTPAGDRRAEVGEDSITVEMGEPSFEPEAVPLDADEPMIDEPFEGMPVTAVNTGVPHAVAFLHDIDNLDLQTVAQPIRYADRFPEGTNVTVAETAGSTAFRQRTYERGVEGETKSCGTGAVAIVVTAVRLGLVEAGEPVSVRPPGGELTVTVPDTGPATLAGPTSFVGEGTVSVAVKEGTLSVDVEEGTRSVNVEEE